MERFIAKDNKRNDKALSSQWWVLARVALQQRECNINMTESNGRSVLGQAPPISPYTSYTHLLTIATPPAVIRISTKHYHLTTHSGNELLHLQRYCYEANIGDRPWEDQLVILSSHRR